MVRECVGGPALQVVHSVGDDGLAPWVREEEEDTFNLASGEDLIDLSSETMSGGGSFRSPLTELRRIPQHPVVSSTSTTVIMMRLV